MSHREKVKVKVSKSHEAETGKAKQASRSQEALGVLRAGINWKVKKATT